MGFLNLFLDETRPVLGVSAFDLTNLVSNNTFLVSHPLQEGVAGHVGKSTAAYF